MAPALPHPCPPPTPPPPSLPHPTSNPTAHRPPDRPPNYTASPLRLSGACGRRPGRGTGPDRAAARAAGRDGPGFPGLPAPAAAASHGSRAGPRGRAQRVSGSWPSAGTPHASEGARGGGGGGEHVHVALVGSPAGADRHNHIPPRPLLRPPPAWFSIPRGRPCRWRACVVVASCRCCGRGSWRRCCTLAASRAATSPGWTPPRPRTSEACRAAAPGW